MKQRSVLPAIVLAIGFGAGIGSARAQEPVTPGAEITVEAPRTVPLDVERSPYTGAAVAVTTLKMPVLYGDLDLTAERDGERLMTRIANVSRDLCKQLDRLHPFNPDPDCARKAAANAAPRAQAAIAAARVR